MGLDVSHGAFSGAYSAFNRFRQAVCFVLGGSFPRHFERNEDFTFTTDPPTKRSDLDEGIVYFGRDLDEDSGLAIFLGHSDCDGEISPDDCVRVADEIEPLLPQLAKLGAGGGHISFAGGYAEVARKFVEGCRLAASNNEPLTFD